VAEPIIGFEKTKLEYIPLYSDLDAHFSQNESLTNQF